MTKKARKAAPRGKRHELVDEAATAEATPDASAPATPPAEPAAQSAYINPELSLLKFQVRVLEEALDPLNPLLERVKFLAIVGSNLDEFFMVRVSALKNRLESGSSKLSIDGLTPDEQLTAIRKEVLLLMRDMERCWHTELLPALREAGVVITPYADLDETGRKEIDAYFRRFIFPVLTPLAFDPSRPFPHISNLSLNLAIMVLDAAGKKRFARVKVPDTLPRFIPVGAGRSKAIGGKKQETRLVLLEEVITANLGDLFPGVAIQSTSAFHVTRDAEMQIQELESSDLLEDMEKSVRKRRFGPVVRLMVDRAMPPTIRRLLKEELEIDPTDIYISRGPLAPSGLMGLCSLPRPDLKYEPFIPAVPRSLRPSSNAPREQDNWIFEAIKRESILLHHPYDSFAPVLDFLRAAVRDPDVLAIKQTLYRVGRNSPVVKLLLEAAEKGKQVSVLVELKARFDEESNIHWARAMEREGVHVVYGLLGLKTHSKTALVVRREGDGIRRYVHLSTGNYNPLTATLYTDIGYFTCAEEFGDDASNLFNYLTGYSAKTEFNRFLVAPINMRQHLEELIRREIGLHREKGGGHLLFKVNALSDQRIIDLLYEASRAGVKVDLLVRGICCLRPGVPGLSENITVTSIVGRFLEHSRVYYFRAGGKEEVYLGSADLVVGKLDQRVEVVFPVEDLHLVRHLKDEILDIYIADTTKARMLLADGTYRRVRPAAGQAPFDSQDFLLHQA